MTKVIEAKLSYDAPNYCPVCGCVNETFSIIKHGFKRCHIKLPPISCINAILKLDKQRFLCKHCNKTNDLVDHNHSISKHVYYNILFELKQKQSVIDISKNSNISHTTIHNWVGSLREAFIINYNHLTEHLSFDEFKSVKEVKGKMSFICADSKTGKVIDILTHRHVTYLKAYFFKYPRKARMKVKTVCIDMVKGYIDLIRQCFPNAKIITDRLRYRKFYGFNYLMTQQDAVLELLRPDNDLDQSYYLMQRLRMAIRSRDITNFNPIISRDYTEYPHWIKTTIKTLNYYKESINNVLVYEYSNRKLEGTNNLIKVIKRIAFGYRSFENFRSRILLICKPMIPIKEKLPQN